VDPADSVKVEKVRRKPKAGSAKSPLVQSNAPTKVVLKVKTSHFSVRALVQRSFSTNLKAARQGYPVRVVEDLSNYFNVPRGAFSDMLGLQRRTLQRRAAEGQHLKPDESDKVYRVAKIATLAEEVFGSPEKARAWLGRPSRELNNLSPLSVLDTEVGADEVQRILGRIEYGVFG